MAAAGCGVAVVEGKALTQKKYTPRPVLLCFRLLICVYPCPSAVLFSECYIPGCLSLGTGLEGPAFESGLGFAD